MAAIKYDFINKQCNVAFHSSGQIGNIKNITPLRYVNGVLAYKENGQNDKVFHSTLPFVIEEQVSNESEG